MRYLEVKYSQPLKGEVKIPGSKNSSLALLPACCLADEPIILKNIPHILDIKRVFEISKDIGLGIAIKDDNVILDPTRLKNSNIDPQKASSFRASYYFVGALLYKFKRVSIGYPGGDNFGYRPIDQHISGLKALGAKFNFYTNHYVVEADELRGAEIRFDKLTFGGTVNVMLAAVRAKGTTVLYNAAKDPEIADLANLLNSMGANIKGAGTDTIHIEGVNSLKSCIHSVIPDRLIAGAFLMAAGATGGNITIKNVIPEHLESCINKLRQTNLKIDIRSDSICGYVNDRLLGINVEAGMYPEFATDFQQPLTAMLIQANGVSTIIDKVYPGRFNHCRELNKLGAKITIEDNKAIIPGKKFLVGDWVKATDVRAGICLMLAGLTAAGTTYITGIEHIERGYENIVRDFAALGADIVLYDSDAKRK
ncbi:UDP-N-acetylglucosamine 1-carboxyvinyltransferase [Clostridium sp. YIM B02515]|uniref:UDP-N-acetylglucosamine 1-carboxyvinyltransferase n=1 Tax=Clostridium rhizosphaerae TaxID=2803861 RepID=A0ABS1T7W2_9CLOT|nr:UDP-N-acetylglucosamine 1-carboxyvinyltransferase [Clostridium rhizosphaerae]MBL4935420.1 UDP-N-acetylglucosamine 1-carboxyvinyltransferase [Clostridium rhizosphaerae]